MQWRSNKEVNFNRNYRICHSHCSRRSSGWRQPAVAIEETRKAKGYLEDCSWLTTKETDSWMSWFYSNVAVQARGAHSVLVCFRRPCPAVLSGTKLTEDMVETIPEQVDNACLSDDVCLSIIKHFFHCRYLVCCATCCQSQEAGVSLLCNVCKCQIIDS